MVRAEMWALQELVEDLVWDSAHGSCVKFFLNK